MTIRVRRAGGLSTGHASRRNAILLAACIVLAVGSATIRASSSSIERAAELAGFFAAHAVWSVSDITIRDYAQRDVEITIAVPYRPARHAGGFAIHRLKLLGVKGAEADRDSIIAAFRAGIAKHEQGSKIWNRFLDESR